MRKLLPIQKMRKEIEEILKGVPEDLDNCDILEEIMRKGEGDIRTCVCGIGKGIEEMAKDEVYRKRWEYLDKLRKEFGLEVRDEEVIGV